MANINNLGKWEMIFFFSGADVVRACHFSEFESLKDGAARLSEFSSEVVHAVYTKIGENKAIQGLVFFSFVVDADGKIDPDWDVPLQQLVDVAGRGPNLGGGQILLVSRSQCPNSLHQNSLWEPKEETLLAVRQVVAKRLGAIEAPAEPSQVNLEKTLRHYRNEVITYKNQMQAMQQEMEKLRLLNEQKSDKGEAEKLKRQLRNLQQTHKQREETVRLHTARINLKNKQLHEQTQTYAVKIQQYQQQNALLKNTLKTHKTELEARNKSESAKRELAAIEAAAVEAAAIETAANEAAAAIETAAVKVNDISVAAFEGGDSSFSGAFNLGEQLAEIVAQERNSHDTQARIQMLEAQLVREPVSKESVLLEQVRELGGVVMVYHPGAGHINIPIDELEEYVSNPLSVAARHSQVSEAQYRRWLAHQADLSCINCRKQIAGVDMPADFVTGQSDYCEEHR
jgi:hypothetical protein